MNALGLNECGYWCYMQNHKLNQISQNRDRKKGEVQMHAKSSSKLSSQKFLGII